MTEFPEAILQRLEQSAVVAGFSVDKAEHAVPLAQALLTGGIDAVELTLRTEAAMEAVTLICAQVPDMLVGVGTILTPDQVTQVRAAGADFGVAPGMNPCVIRAAQATGLPFAPGICTPSDLEGAIELGCRFVKFFPAETMGGVKYLRSMAAPYMHLGMRYFPLGGLNTENMLDYLVEDVIPCIGGSWIANKDLVSHEDWDGIAERAQDVRRRLNKAGRQL